MCTQCQEQQPSGVSLKPSVSLPSHCDAQKVLMCHGKGSLLWRNIYYFSKRAQVNCSPAGMNPDNTFPVLLSPHLNHLRDIKELKVQTRALQASPPNAKNPLQDPPLPPELPQRGK